VRKEYRQEHGESLPRRVPPGPDNPLGTHTLRLAIPGYLIHGTNKPYGVGMRVTHGCVRMYPEDIRAIFDDVPVDTPVYIVNQPYKAGWRNGLLYVEVHPPLDEDQDQASFSNSRTSTVKAVIGVSPRGNSAISWERAIQASNQASGVPTMISTDLLDVVAILAEAQADLKAKLAEAQLTAQAEED
jgi:L,D-transpeptidase ErfK/SrfK